jgi:hypothetical protein
MEKQMADAGFETPALNDKGREAAAKITTAFDRLIDEVDPYCYSGSHWDRAKRRMEEACGLALRSASLNPANQEDALEAGRAEARRAATAALEKSSAEPEGTVEMLLPPEGAGRAQTRTT